MSLPFDPETDFLYKWLIKRGFVPQSSKILIRIYTEFLALVDGGMKKTRAVLQVSDAHACDPSAVWRLIKRIEDY